MNIIIYIIILCLISTLECFAGAPPSVKQKMGEETSANVTYGLNIEYGYYSPSLKTLNDDLKSSKIQTLQGGPYLAGGLSILNRSNKANIILGIGYWRGETNWVQSITEYKLETTFWIFNVDLGFPIPVIRERLYVTPGIIMRDVIVNWHYSSNSDYYNAMAFIMDIGGKIGTEYFVIPEYKQLSIAVDIGYILWGIMLDDLTVMDSTYMPIGTILYTNDMKNKMNIETDGLILKFRVNFYF